MRNFSFTPNYQLAATYIVYEQLSSKFARQQLNNRFISNCIVEKAILSNSARNNIERKVAEQLEKLPEELLLCIKDMRYELDLDREEKKLRMTFDTCFEIITADIYNNGKVVVGWELSRPGTVLGRGIGKKDIDYYKSSKKCS